MAVGGTSLRTVTVQILLSLASTTAELRKFRNSLCARAREIGDDEFRCLRRTGGDQEVIERD
jgi:hypothetical protein